MSMSCVPPGRTSPYQNGAGAAVKAESSKLIPRQAVLSGDDASERPLKYFQDEPVLKMSVASEGTMESASIKPSKKVRMRVIGECHSDSLNWEFCNWSFR